MTLNADHLPGEGQISYDSQMDRQGVSFTVRFDTATEVIGYPKVRLWVRSDGWDDMDLFVFLQKLDATGNVLEQFNVPNHSDILQNITQSGASNLKYKGSNGHLRVSLRHLDQTRPPSSIPVHTFDRVEKLAPNEIVPVEIDTFPVGLAFRAGQQLRLTVCGHNPTWWSDAEPVHRISQAGEPSEP
jgi:uncharacterized protein